MKKIFSFITSAVTAAMMMSCEISSGGIYELGRSELSDYAEVLFCNNVLLPVDMVDFAIDLDEYIALPEKEKEQSNRFYGNIRKISEGVYQFSDSKVTCTIDTGGDSIWDDGAQWKFLEYSTRVFATGFSDPGWNAWITDEAKFTFNTDTVGDALLMVQAETVSGDLLMALKAREEGLCSWNLSVEGTDHGKNGLYAEYNSGYGTGCINIKERYTVNEYYNITAQEKICDGTFNVDIYDGDSKIDWIKIHLSAGYMTEYETSR